MTKFDYRIASYVDYEVQKALIIEELIQENPVNLNIFKFNFIPKDINFRSAEIKNYLSRIFKQMYIDNFFYFIDSTGTIKDFSGRNNSIGIHVSCVVQIDIDTFVLDGLEISVYSTEYPSKFLRIMEESFNLSFTHYVSDNKLTPISFAFPTTTGLNIIEKTIDRVPFSTIKENYTLQVGEQFKDIIKKIDEAEKGLIILNGPPGTGKSYLIRSLLAEIRGRYGIICSPPIHFLNNLNDLTSVMTQRRKSLLIFEDVGDLLAYENVISHVNETSNLLNVSEGLLSILSNAIFVLSFNFDVNKINEALLRPGRCLGHIEIGTLPYKKAQTLVPFTIPEQEYTLAEIYEINNSKKPLPKKIKGSNFLRKE